MITAAVGAVILLGLFVSGSRSGWVFLAFPLMISTWFSKRKILGIFLTVTIILAVFVSLSRFEFFSQRVEKTVRQVQTRSLEDVTAGRTLIWKEALGHPHISWLLFGEGFGIMKGAHTHSNYIAMLKNTGCIGIIFWILLYIKIIKKSFWLSRHDQVTEMAAFFAGVFWCYIGYFVFWLPSTPMMWSSVRYVDFFLMALVFLRFKQAELEEPYLYDYELQDEHLEYQQQWQPQEYSEPR